MGDTKGSPRSPFRGAFSHFIPDPNYPPSEGNPCLGLNRRDVNYVQRAKDCPMRDLPMLNIGRHPDIKRREPDLVISAHQSILLSESAVVHAVAIRNIGTGPAIIGSYEEGKYASISCLASMNPLIDGELNVDYRSAGFWSLQDQELAPGDEIELGLEAGTGTRPDLLFTSFNYIVASLSVSPSNDAHTENNISVAPLLPE